MSMSFLHDLYSSIIQRDIPLRRKHKDRSQPDCAAMTDACERLMRENGEASSVSASAAALDIWGRLNDADKTLFFQVLLDEYSAAPEAIDSAYAAYRENRGHAELERLFAASEPRRQALFRRLNLSSGATLELVHMREDLLDRMKSRNDFQAIDADFQHLFMSWFNRGFLVLRSIDWNTPAVILEKLSRYEAVHAIHDWEDLRRRLDARDRRCFAFFHPALRDEPLIFVEVALHRGIPDQIQRILKNDGYDIEDPFAADTAAFFGISNCQTGLRGISFGNFLLKQVVQELKSELPGLRYFSTLSPVPGFRKWLDSSLTSDQWQFDETQLATLALLKDADWHFDETKSAALKALVEPLAAAYLLEEKNAQGLPQNAVARFHLGNGAELHRINWLGDTSSKGLAQSAGLMVNYLYVLEKIEANNEQFSSSKTIARTSAVADLAKRSRKLRFSESTQ